MTARRWLWLLIGAYAALLLGLWLRFGVRTGLDTPTHLQLATTFPDWQALWPQRIWYASYYAVLALLGAGRVVFGGIILLQVGLAVGAFAALVQALDRRVGRVAAITGGALFLLALDVHTWHFYLYSESLYISASVLLLLAWTAEDVSPRKLRWLIPLTLVAALIRPTGFVLLVVMAWCLYQRLAPRQQRRARWVALAGVVGLVLLANQMLRGFLYIWFNKQGYVIYGYEDWKIAFPPDGYHPPNETPPLIALLQFYGSAPGFALELWGTRLWAQLVPLRPYFGLAHNVYLAGLCLLLYPLALWGAWHKRFSLLTQVVGLFVGLSTLIPMLLGVDWDNRFWVPTVAPLCLLAGVGAQHLWNRRHERSLPTHG